MSKTYQALIKAQELRAAQDPTALARRVERAAEECETLRSELRVCQEQVAALVQSVDAAPTVDPAVIDELSRRIARLAEQQKRLATEPHRLIEAATQRFEEVQGGVEPTLERIRGELDELRRHGRERQRSQQREQQTLAERLAQVSETMTGMMRSVEAQQREQQHLLQEVAALPAVQQDGARQAQRLTELTESVESVGERLDEVDAARRTEAARLQADVQGLREGVDLLRTAVAESAAASAVQPEQVETLRTELDSLRQRTGELTEAQERQQRVAEDVRRAQASADEAERRLERIDDAQAANAETLRQQLEELRDDLRGKVSSLEASLAGPLPSLNEIAELRTQMATLVEEVQARQQQICVRVERAQASAEDATRRIAAIDGAQSSNAETLRRHMEELRRDLLDRVSSLETLPADPLPSRNEIEELRVQLGTLAEQARQQEQMAESVKRAQATAEAAAQQATASDEARASSLAQLQQQIAELRDDGTAVREALGAVQSSRAEQLDLAAAVEALRTQIAPLAQVQAGQNELADAVGRAQSTADEARRRIATAEETHGSIRAELQKQLDALQTESGAWRDVAATVKSVLARQEETAGELDAVRAQLTRMLEAQERQQRLFEELLVAPTDGDESRAAGEASAGSVDLAHLQRQVVALQAARLKLDGFIEARFELLCDILDAELQAKVDELRVSLGGRSSDSGSLQLKMLPEALRRGASSIAGLHKKTR